MRTTDLVVYASKYISELPENHKLNGARSIHFQELLSPKELYYRFAITVGFANDLREHTYISDVPVSFDDKAVEMQVELMMFELAKYVSWL